MRHPAKLFGLTVLTALIMNVPQVPSFSVEFWEFRQPQAAYAQTAESALVLLETEGVLAEGGEALTDGSLFNSFFFEGRSGQTIGITLESIEFDTFLFLIDANGNEIARNDDIDTNAGNYHSFISITLPEDGTYEIWANGLDNTARGKYRLMVVESEEEITLPLLSPTAIAQVEANQHLNQCFQQIADNQFREAIQSCEQAVIIYQEIGDYFRVGRALGNLGVAYFDLEEYQRAIEFHEQHLAVARKIQVLDEEIRSLGNLGDAYIGLQDYQLAIDTYKQQIAAIQSLPDGTDKYQANLIEIYRKLTNIYDDNRDLPAIIQASEAGLAIAGETDDIASQAFFLLFLAENYGFIGNYGPAITSAERLIDLAGVLNNSTIEGTALFVLADIYDSQGQYQEAINTAEQAFQIALESENLWIQGYALNVIASAYASLRQYRESIYAAQASIEIATTHDLPGLLPRAWSALIIAYADLGDYEALIDASRSFLESVQPSNATATENVTPILSALDRVFQNFYMLTQGQYQVVVDDIRAFDLSTLDGSPVLSEYDIQSFQGTMQLLLAMGLGGLEQYEEGLSQALAASATLQGYAGTSTSQGLALFLEGSFHRRLGQIDLALDKYRQASILNNVFYVQAGIARVYRDMDMPDLAIGYYKQAINQVETVRTNVSGMDTALQQAVLQSLADFDDLRAGDVYRELAELLLAQGRIPEAQQVLDLLKVEELQEFTHTRATWTGSTLAYTDPEQAVIESHGSLIALGRQILDCEAANCGDINVLYDQQEALKAQYDRQVAEFNRIVRANRAEDDVFQTPETISGEAEKLLAAYAEAGETAVLIYPFVLQDKLWLVWATAGNVIGSVEVPVPQDELSATVQRFGELLNRGEITDLQTTSQQLYDWIIKPLETELTTNNVDHLIFVNDRVTRYIPMAALFDGESFLLERYRISTVLSPAITETEGRLGQVNESQVLGLGVTQAVAGFSPLPAVADELTAIVRDEALGTKGIFPGRVFLDDDFTFDALRDNVTNHRVLHIATHAAFVPGRAQESFIVLGNGDRLSIPDIETIERRLRNLHLVVLSACQTALGGPAGDGTEIAGLSSYFLRTGRAEAVVASLWKVNDGSTSLLMQHFYELLATGELTKAEALRQAQLSLLYNEDTETRLAAMRGEVGYATSSNREPSTISSQHPYHWAPFILIGNGL